MHPVLFKIFGFEVRSWGVLLVLGVLAGIWLAARRARRFGIDPRATVDMAWLLLIAGVIGGRLGWVLQELPYYLERPIEVFYLRAGGMTSYGGVAGAALALLFWSRRAGVPFVVALDWLAAPALVVNAVGRIGCFLNGCCYGVACDLPWAVMVHPEGDGVAYLGHPAQLYDTVLSLLGAALLLWYEQRSPTALARGRLTGFFLLAYGASRIVLEVFRAGASSGSSFGWAVPDGLIVAVLLVVGGLVMLVRSRGAPVTEGSRS